MVGQRLYLISAAGIRQLNIAACWQGVVGAGQLCANYSSNAQYTTIRVWVALTLHRQTQALGVFAAILGTMHFPAVELHTGM